VALGMTNEENLEGITQSIAAVMAVGREAIIDCEHFFDGYKSNRAYALSVATIAYKAGARWVVLCDTNGGTLPHEITQIVTDAATHVPGTHLGIHAHNDTENAVANTLAAVRCGVRQIQGTLNGLGERCGNANLVSIIPTLLLKNEFADDTAFRAELELDSLDFLSFVEQLSSATGVRIDEDDYPRLRTLRSCVEFLTGD